MSLTELPLLLYVLLYFALAAQGVFYLLCFRQVFAEGSPGEFIKMRKKAAPILEPRLSIIYYSCLLTGATTLFFSLREGWSASTFFTLISYCFLLADVVLAKKFNIPLNSAIALIDPDTVSSPQAADIQQTWLRWIGIRGRIMISGFVLILVQNFYFS